MKTRAMVATGPGQMEMQEFPLPEVGPEDGILKLELIGVCGSDPGIFKGKASRAPRPYPIILGHEIVGRVYKMGEEAKKRHGVEEGDRVIIEYAFGCGKCRPCLEGRYTLCERYYTYGSMVSCAEPPHLFGAYADYMYIHPRAMLHKVSEDLEAGTAVLICAVLGNAVRWLRHIGGASLGQAVAIVGPGQQGLAAAAVAKEVGAGPVMLVGLERDAPRLAMASRFGADLAINADREDPREAVSRATGGAMAGLVMDVSGSPAGARTALSLCGLGASLVLPGLYGGQTEVPLLLDQVVFKELKLLGAFSHDFRAVEPAIKLAAKGNYPWHEMITHRLPLREALQGIKLVAGEVPGESAMKVVLDPSL